MDTSGASMQDRRVAIGNRSRRRALEDKDRRVVMAAFGMLGYLAFANLAGGMVALLAGKQPMGIVLASLAVGGLFAWGAWSAWVHDEFARWFVVLPVVLTMVLDLLMLGHAGLAPLIGLVFNVVLLALMPLHAKFKRKLAGIPAE